jgi:ABC-2 type transport system permease protein/sodium transport system permease protein
MVAIICNTIYALAALAIASRLFGSDASMHGSKGSWRDLMLRPDTRQTYPTVDQMALTMAIMFPLYFVVSSSLPGFSSDLATSLWLSAAASWLLILGVPLFATWYRNIEFATTFRLAGPTGSRWRVLLPAILLIASGAWMIAHEIILLAQAVGIGVIQFDQFERVAQFQERLKQLPLAVVLLTLAVTPAICEEVLFRGFVLSSLHKKSTTWAIVLAIERFLPTTFMGLILGWLAIRTRSIWPGMLLHVLHNGLLLCMSHYEDQLKTWNGLGENTEHLPATWLVAGGLALVAGLVMVKWTGRVELQAAVPEQLPAAAPTTSPTTGAS